MKKKQTCAYCLKSALLSREHIWPKWILSSPRKYEMMYSEQARKVFSGDLVIRDVCAACNNGPLSGLDSYVKQLYMSYFIKFADKGLTVFFEYDYDKLLRWLLKISYNSARTTGSQKINWISYLPYILGTATRPLTIRIKVQLVAPTTIIESIESSNIIVPKIVYPKSIRCGRFEHQNKSLYFCDIRCLSINSYYFYLIIMKAAKCHLLSFEEEAILNTIPGVTLPQESSFVRLSTSISDTLEMHSEHFQSQRDAYKDYLNALNKPNGF